VLTSSAVIPSSRSFPAAAAEPVAAALEDGLHDDLLGL